MRETYYSHVMTPQPQDYQVFCFIVNTELEDRVSSTELTVILHGEQLGVHENSIALLEEQINVLEVSDEATDDRLVSLEVTDVTLDKRINDVELFVNLTLEEGEFSNNMAVIHEVVLNVIN